MGMLATAASCWPLSSFFDAHSQEIRQEMTFYFRREMSSRAACIVRVGRLTLLLARHGGPLAACHFMDDEGRSSLDIEEMGWTCHTTCSADVCFSHQEYWSDGKRAAFALVVGARRAISCLSSTAWKVVRPGSASIGCRQSTRSPSLLALQAAEPSRHGFRRLYLLLYLDECHTQSIT